jgi:hypothetical protein
MGRCGGRLVERGFGWKFATGKRGDFHSTVMFKHKFGQLSFGVLSRKKVAVL